MYLCSTKYLTKLVGSTLVHNIGFSSRGWPVFPASLSHTPTQPSDPPSIKAWFVLSSLFPAFFLLSAHFFAIPANKRKPRHTQTISRLSCLDARATVQIRLQYVVNLLRFLVAITLAAFLGRRTEEKLRKALFPSIRLTFSL